MIGNLGTVANLCDMVIKNVYIYMDDLNMYVNMDSIYDKVIFEYPEFKDFETFVSEDELLFEVYDFDITSVDYIRESGICVKTKQSLYKVAKLLYGMYN